MTRILSLALWSMLCFVSPVLAHDPNSANAPLHEFHLRGHRHVHASFLMLKNDLVYLENEKDEVKTYPIDAFSKADQAIIREKEAQIAQMNRAVATRPAVPVQSVRLPQPAPATSLWIWLLPAAALAFFLAMRKRKSWQIASVIGVAALLLSFKTEIAKKLLGTDPLFMDAAFQPFKPNVATHWDNTWFYVESKGIPTTHSMMTGITKWQQQVPVPQCYIGSNAWQIPLNPVLAVTPVPVNDQHFLRGAVAIAANGIPIFNPHTNTGVDAFLDGQLDQWGGHSGRADDYHYHIAPMFLDTQTVDILPIAFALDGFAIYADHEPDGTPMQPLDANHGHFDAAGVYHYHGTADAPYMIGNMVGQVTEDATLQIIPQSKATPIRPSLTPLNGAVITDLHPNGGNNGYVLTYTRNGQTYQVDYNWTNSGVYTYNFISPTGTTTETYNGFLPCNVPVANEEIFQKQAPVYVYPNPSSDAIFLNVNDLDIGKEYSFSIFDVNGKALRQGNGKAVSGSGIEVGTLPKGIYVVKISFGQGEISRKIVIQ